MKDKKTEEELKQKCEVCGRPVYEHQLAITFFKYGEGVVSRKEQYYADRYHMGKEYIMVKDDCVLTYHSSDEVAQMEVIKFYEWNRDLIWELRKDE